MTNSPIPLSLPVVDSEAGVTPAHKSKTVATRLPRDEMQAVEEAAKAAGKTCSEWLRDAAITHLGRPVVTRKPVPDPILLAEVLALRSVLVNLLSAAMPELSREAVQKIVTYADSIKHVKADEILNRLNDQDQSLDE